MVSIIRYYEFINTRIKILVCYDVRTMTKKTLDYSNITDRLMIGVTPKNIDYLTLKSLGVKLIINMRAERYAPRFRNRKFIKTVWVPTFDSRLLPIRPNRLVATVKLASGIINNGGKVYVYCRRGRHRSVVMGAAILIAQKFTVQDSVKLIKNNRKIADPDKQHIKRAIVDFAKFWADI